MTLNTQPCANKYNTKSCTEAELVTIDATMGQILWIRLFLIAQGKNVPTITIYQDSKSTILLSKNGRISSSRRMRHYYMRHYYMRHFFVTDKIKKEK